MVDRLLQAPSSGVPAADNASDVPAGCGGDPAADNAIVEATDDVPAGCGGVPADNDIVETTAEYAHMDRTELAQQVKLQAANLMKREAELNALRKKNRALAMRITRLKRSRAALDR